MMSRDFQVDVESKSDLSCIASAIKSITLSGEKVFNVSENSSTSLFIYTTITRYVEPHEFLELNGKCIGKFVDIFTNIAIKSGMHVPEGSFWCSDKNLSLPEHEFMPLTNLFSLTLKKFGIHDNSPLGS